jgi:hypothetical protein
MMRKYLLSLLLVFSLCASLYTPVFATGEETSCVAATESKQYDNLSDALWESENGETVTLLTDVEVEADEYLIVFSDLTLDLNGHHITQTCTTPADGDGTNELLSVSSYSTLIIQDSEGTGGIEYTGSEADYAILNSGTLCVRSGSIFCDNIAILTQGEESKTAIEGGTVTGGNAAIAVNVGTATVTGGTIRSFNTSAIDVNGGSVTVTGGTIQSGGESIPAIVTEHDESVSISGGTIIGKVDSSFYEDFIYYESISQYRSSEGYTYPAIEGRVFCGWYKNAGDAKCMTKSEANQAETGAYAKYVDEAVLSLGMQIICTTTADSDETNLRLVTTVDSDQYQKVGFWIRLGEIAENEWTSRSVTTIQGVSGESREVKVYDPSVFSTDSKYFLAFVLTDIPQDYFNTNFTVIPFWITRDGTRVEGVSSSFTISEIINTLKNMQS